MEIELTDRPTQPEKGQGRTSQRRFVKDEAIIARFGKRQQLRVGAPLRASDTASLARNSRSGELVPLNLCYREDSGCYRSLA